MRAVAHRELDPWPDLSVEKCVRCGLPPGTKGCLVLGSMYDGIRVDHTNRVDSHRLISQVGRKTSSESAPPPELNSFASQSDDGSAVGANVEYYSESFSSEGFEPVEVKVDIESSPQASLVTGTQLGGRAEGGASDIPETKVLDSNQ